MENLGGIFGILGLICVLYLASCPVLQMVVDQFRKQGKAVPKFLKKIF